MISYVFYKQNHTLSTSSVISARVSFPNLLTSTTVMKTHSTVYRKLPMYNQLFKGIQQYIFLLFHLEELLKLYVNLFYRFCVTLLFLLLYYYFTNQLAFRHLGFWRICMWHHKQGHARILSIEQLVIMSPKSYTSVTIWNKKLSDDFSNKT